MATLPMRGLLAESVVLGLQAVEFSAQLIHFQAQVLHRGGHLREEVTEKTDVYQLATHDQLGLPEIAPVTGTGSLSSRTEEPERTETAKVNLRDQEVIRRPPHGQQGNGCQVERPFVYGVTILHRTGIRRIASTALEDFQRVETARTTR